MTKGEKIGERGTHVGELYLLGRLLENSKVAITVVDTKGNLILFNRAAELLTGYTREEVMGQTVSIFYESREELERIAKTVMEHGKVENREVTLLTKDGHRLPVSILVTALHDSEGAFVGSLGITVDIREQKRLEQDVLEQKRLVAFYNDLLFHDILNFSQAALGFLELLLEDISLSEEQKRLLKLSKRQSNRIQNLVRRVRTLSVLESEEGRVVTPILLGPVIEQAVSEVIEAHPETKIELCSYHPDIRVWASPLLLDLVENLLTNGVVHNPSPNPVVWVTVREIERGDEAFVQVTVEDNGAGISDERKQLVFERYRKTNEHGSGLALSLAKELVDLFGGEIWAEDRVEKDPSEGARIVLVLRRVWE